MVLRSSVSGNDVSAVRDAVVVKIVVERASVSLTGG